MKIRKSCQSDIEAIMNLIHQAQNYFKTNRIDQWQDGYPLSENILHDISLGGSYVLDNYKVIGTMFFTFIPDDNYKNIDGKWLTKDQVYGVIHRIVVDETQKGQGLANELLDFAVKECCKNNVHSIRIDTHKDNYSMHCFLKKNGFELCGCITLESGAPRIAFEKIIE